MQTIDLTNEEMAIVCEMRKLRSLHNDRVFEAVNKALVDTFKDHKVDIDQLSRWPGFHDLTKTLMNYLKNNNVLYDNVEFNIGVR